MPARRLIQTFGHTPRGLLEDLLVQRQVGDRTAQPLVLLLELLETTQLVAARPAILLTPPIEFDLANPELTDRVRHRHALAVCRT